MSTTLRKEIIGVRDFLGQPLPQSPSVRDILVEMEAEYQDITNQLNDRENAWLTDETVITTVSGKRDYRLDTQVNDFYKALSIRTLPDSASVTQPGVLKGADITYPNLSGSDSEENLELTELENIPAQYSNLKDTGGQLFVGKSGLIVATYRQIHSQTAVSDDNSYSGEAIYLRLHPIPTTAGKRFVILYQVTDWWDKLFSASNTMNQRLPNSSQRMYLRSLVAMNLVTKGIVKWSLNKRDNDDKRRMVIESLGQRLDRYRESFNKYIDSLDNSDVTYLDLWVDEVGL